MSGARPPDCLQDATTLRGLVALRRRFPRSWAERMRRAARAVGPEATVAEALRTGGMGRLLPRAATAAEASRLKKLRHCARRLVAVYGDVVLGSIDEDWLRRERPRAGARMGVGRDVAGAAFTLLRRVAWAAQQWGGEVRVRRRLPPRRRPAMGEPCARPPAPWRTIERLVADAADLQVRAAVALQLHIGASPGRTLAVRVRDVDLDAGTVRVPVPGRGGRVWVTWALPPDAAAAIRPWWQRMRRRRGPGAPLFPRRGRPDRPTRSVTAALRRAARALGEAPTTLQAIRRHAQAGLRAVGAVRAQVRGSARRPVRGQGVTAVELGRQRNAWGAQRGEPERRVPLRAPRRCHADEPERARRRRWRWAKARVPRTPLRRWEGRWRPPEESPDGHAAGSRAGAGGRHDQPTPTSPPLPDFVRRPPTPNTLVLRQPVPGPPRVQDLLGAGVVGAALGAAAGLAAPERTGEALQFGAQVLAAVAQDLVSGRQGSR